MSVFFRECRVARQQTQPEVMMTSVIDEMNEKILATILVCVRRFTESVLLHRLVSFILKLIEYFCLVFFELPID